MFSSGNNCASVPLVASIGGSGGSNGNNGDGMFGGGVWSWLIIVLFLFVFLGWGNNWGGGNSNGGGGNSMPTYIPIPTSGFGGSSSSSVMDSYVLNSDFATLQRQIDSGFANTTAGITQVNNGLCNGFYQEAQLVNGVQMQIANEARGTDNAICNLGNSMMQGFNTANVTALQGQNAVATQIADCCCKTQSGMKDIQFQNAQDTCAITNAIAQAARDGIDNANANYRALHDEIVANRIEDKNATIAAQNQQIFQLQLAASQANQNNYLVDRLMPTARPAYITCSPYASAYGIGFNNGCGCNCA